MATHDYVLDNATGANFRSDLNNALAAIVSNNSSSTEPSTKYAYQWWADTNEGVLKIRNSSNDGWVTLLQLDGTLTLEDGTNTAPALGFRDDLNTGIFSSAADTLDITCGGTTRGSFSASGLSVTGNITVSGTVDGRDLATDGTKLDGIAASATNNGSGNAITDGDKGDITVSSSGGTFTIDNDVVTTAKMINFPTGTLLGRTTAGTGNATTLTASEVRTLLNVEDGATADQTKSDIDALGIAASTATTATNANHISVADNESTNENNLIPFIEDASATGNVGLESDGDFTYNPSTGTVTATKFVGDGSGLTGIASGSGAQGGSNDEIFYLSDKNATANYEITGHNAMAAGPLTIDSGVTITVASGCAFTVV